jgi:hypothetical protein
MAFPTSITGLNGSIAQRVGRPCLSSGGNVYVVGVSASDRTKLQVYKATDPSSSWSQAGADVTLANGIKAFASFQVGDAIHVATHDGPDNALGTNVIRYHVFSISSDSWTTSNEDVKTAYSAMGSVQDDGSPDWGEFWIGIAVRSDGDVIILYQGVQSIVMGTSRPQTKYARKESGTWTIDVDVGGDTVKGHVPSNILMTANDRAHLIYGETTTGTFGKWLKTLNSANSLSAAQDRGTPSSINFATAIPGVSSVDISGTVKCSVFQVTANNEISGHTFDDADTPSLTLRSDITGTTNVVNGIEPGQAIAVAVNGTTTWAFFPQQTTSDIYRMSSTDGGATWGTPASFATGPSGTISWVSGNVYTRGGNIVFGVLYSEGGTVKYDEYVIGSAGPTTHNGQATITSTSTAAAAAQRVVHGQATITSTSEVTAAGSTSLTHDGQAAIDSASSVTASAQRVVLAQAEIAATSTTSAAARVVLSGAASVESSSTVAAAAQRVAQGQAAVSSESAVTAAGQRVAQGQAAIAGSSSVSASGVLTLVAAASIASASEVTANGVLAVYQNGAATIASDSALTAAGQRVAQGQVAIASESAVIATGALITSGQATVASSSSVTAAAAIIYGDAPSEIFSGTGVNGTWLDSTPLTRFQTTSTSGTAISAYGDRFGRWVDRSGNARDPTTTATDSTRPQAVQGTSPNDWRFYGFLRDTVLSAAAIGGTNATGFYCAFAGQPTNYYGELFSDVNTTNTGFRLLHDADGNGTVPQFIFSAGTGSARVEVRIATGNTIFTNPPANTPSVIECWWDGSQIHIRRNGGTAVSASCSTVSAGTSDLRFNGNLDASHKGFNIYELVSTKTHLPASDVRGRVRDYLTALTSGPPVVYRDGSATVTSTSTLDVAPSLRIAASAAVAATSTIAAAARRVAQAQAQIDALSTVLAGAEVYSPYQNGSAIIAAISSASAAATVTGLWEPVQDTAGAWTEVSATGTTWADAAAPTAAWATEAADPSTWTDVPSSPGGWT